MAKPKATLRITLPVWTGRSDAYPWRKEVLNLVNQEINSPARASRRMPSWRWTRLSTWLGLERVPRPTMSTMF